MVVDIGGKRKILAVWAFIALNVGLLVVKGFVAFLSGSVALLGDAVDTASDLFVSFVSAVSIYIALKPADESHPFGHGKFETLGGFFQGLLLLGMGTYVLVKAIHRWFQPEEVSVDLALWVAGITAGAKWLFTRWFRKVAHETDSDVLRANLANISSDIFASGVVILGLLAVRWTGNPVYDAIAGVLIVGFIFTYGFHVLYEMAGSLVDTMLPPEEVGQIEKILQGHPEIRGYHQLRTRKSGSHRHIDVHILLDDHLSLVKAHEITEEVEDQIRSALPNVSISIHTEPYEYEMEHRRQAHGDE
jgi:cation diffusion facilitator family transporter